MYTVIEWIKRGGVIVDSKGEPVFRFTIIPRPSKRTSR